MWNIRIIEIYSQHLLIKSQKNNYDKFFKNRSKKRMEGNQKFNVYE